MQSLKHCAAPLIGSRWHSMICKEFRFAVRATAPDRADRMNDNAGRESIAFGNLRFTSPASAEQPAFTEQFRSGCAMDRTIDAATTQE